jgi:hypothetical protein
MLNVVFALAARGTLTKEMIEQWTSGDQRRLVGNRRAMAGVRTRGVGGNPRPAAAFTGANPNRAVRGRTAKEDRLQFHCFRWRGPAASKAATSDQSSTGFEMLSASFDLDTEVAHGAFELSMPEQKLKRPEVYRFLVDLRG